MRRLTVALMSIAIGWVAVAAATPSASAQPRGAKRPAKPKPYQKILQTGIKDIQAFWSEQLPAVYGIDYDPIPKNRIIAYTSRTKPSRLAECAQRKGATYKELKNNAFYCALDDTVSYDDQSLFPTIDRDFGDFAIVMFLAHEWGHAIQARTQTQGPTIALETQADCLAGAWAAHVNSGASKLLTLDTGDLDVGLAGLLHVADPVGTDPTQEGAHGTGFDRANSFEEGFNGGVARCKAWDTNPPPFTEIPFQNAREQASGGDLPYGETVDVTLKDLDGYWSQVITPYKPITDVVRYDPSTKRSLPKCATLELDGRDANAYERAIFYCPDSDYVAWDDRFLGGVRDHIGDFGAAVLISGVWAEGMEQRLGVTGSPKAIELEADCFSGSWAGSLAFGLRRGEFTLSPGDLDEVIQAFILFAPEPGSTRNPRSGQGADKASTGDQGTEASVFDRVQAFRTGFFGTNAEQTCATVAR